MSIFAAWINNDQQDQLEYQRTLIQVLREKLGPKRIVLNDDQPSSPSRQRQGSGP